MKPDAAARGSDGAFTTRGDYDEVSCSIRPVGPSHAFACYFAGICGRLGAAGTASGFCCGRPCCPPSRYGRGGSFVCTNAPQGRRADRHRRHRNALGGGIAAEGADCGVGGECRSGHQIGAGQSVRSRQIHPLTRHHRRCAGLQQVQPAWACDGRLCHVGHVGSSAGRGLSRRHADLGAGADA